MKTELIRNLSTAWDIAHQEDRIRSALDDHWEIIKTEKKTIDIVANFLADYPDCTSNEHWAHFNTSMQQHETGTLIGRLACLATLNPTNALVDYLIFKNSNIFKWFKMGNFSQAIGVAREIIKTEFPQGNRLAFNRMDTIVDYLQNK